MSCKHLGEILGKYDCGCPASEPDVAVRRCTHPAGLVELAIEVAPGRGVVDRLSVVLDGAKAAEKVNVARCQTCSLNTDPPAPPKPRAVQAAKAESPKPESSPVAGRRSWVDPSRIRRSEKST